MTSRSRTLSGAALMLLIIPIFAGLLACMPVPIGDPERSRIDPDLTGVWAVLPSDDSEAEPRLYLFEPYDKRTWLITGIQLKGGDSVDLDQYDFFSYEGYEKLAANEKVAADHVYASELILYKAWLTKLGGERFFTWEPKGNAAEPNEDPEYWIVFQVNKASDSSIILRMVNGEAELFDDVDKTRRAYERVLKKHADEPEIYGGPDDEYHITLVRAEDQVLSFLEDVIGFVVSD